jgi:hypothetical protein
VTFTATDASGRQSSCSTPVSVVDTIPPTLEVIADPVTLWPPNHEMVPVALGWTAQDQCDGTAAVTLVSVTSSEPDDATGNDDGATTGDVQGAEIGAPDTEVLLRTERNGRGPGRIYTLTYQAVDRSGHATPGLATVTVPHDEGQGPEPLLMRVEPVTGGSGGVHLYWPTVNGASAYDVISGSLNSWHVENGVLNIGAVRVLGMGVTTTSLNETGTEPVPAVGEGIFYLIQQRTATGAAGYGTETGPWPRVPSSCEDGCPPAVTGTSGEAGIASP